MAQGAGEVAPWGGGARRRRREEAATRGACVSVLEMCFQYGSLKNIFPHVFKIHVAGPMSSTRRPLIAHILAVSHIGPQNLRSLKQQERTHKFAGAACISTRAPQDNTPARVNKGVKAFSTVPHGCSTLGHGGGATRPDPIGGPAGAWLLNRRARTPTRRSASVAWPTARAQYLEENTLLIEAIRQNQNLGRLDNCLHYMLQLQQNLIYLGVHLLPDRWWCCCR